MIKENLTPTFCKKCNYKSDPRMPECPKCGHILNKDSQNLCRTPLIYLDGVKILLIIITWLVAMYLLPSFVILMAGIMTKGDGTLQEAIKVLQSNSVFFMALQLTVYIVGSIVGIIILRRYWKFVFREAKNYKNYAIPALICVLMVGITFLLNYLIFDLGGLETNKNQASIVKMMADTPALSFFAVVIFGPFFEELMFRVAIFALGNKANKIVAYIITILLFVIVHLNFIGENINVYSELAAIPGYFIAAGALCFAYERYGLVGSLLIHVVNNLIQYIMVLAQ